MFENSVAMDPSFASPTPPAPNAAPCFLNSSRDQVVGLNSHARPPEGLALRWDLPEVQVSQPGTLYRRTADEAVRMARRPIERTRDCEGPITFSARSVRRRDATRKFWTFRKLPLKRVGD